MVFLREPRCSAGNGMAQPLTESTSSEEYGRSVERSPWFPEWKHKLPPYWQVKIQRTRARDRKNFRKLRREGWTVMRFWDHQVKKNLSGIIDRIEAAVKGVRDSRSRHPDAVG
jgi:Protein of unknown function (DUF559)